ncbi:MAG: hypothetical protein ACSW8J_02925, partial [bacterium]
MTAFLYWPPIHVYHIKAVVIYLESISDVLCPDHNAHDIPAPVDDFWLYVQATPTKGGEAALFVSPCRWERSALTALECVCQPKSEAKGLPKVSSCQHQHNREA